MAATASRGQEAVEEIQAKSRSATIAALESAAKRAGGDPSEVEARERVFQQMRRAHDSADDVVDSQPSRSEKATDVNAVTEVTGIAVSDTIF